jgi:hypothetical protein
LLKFYPEFQFYFFYLKLWVLNMEATSLYGPSQMGSNVSAEVKPKAASPLSNPSIGTIAQQALSSRANPSSSPNLRSNRTQRKKARKEFLDLCAKLEKSLKSCYKDENQKSLFPQGMAHFFHFTPQEFFKVFFSACFDFMLNFDNSAPRDGGYESCSAILQEFIEVFQTDLSASANLERLKEVAKYLFMERLSEFKEENKEKAIETIRGFYWHLMDHFSLLDLSSNYRFSLNELKEPSAELPYKLLVHTASLAISTLNEIQEHLLGIKQHLSPALDSKHSKLDKQQKADRFEMLKLIERFNILKNRYALSLKKSEKQFALMMRNGRAVTPQDQLEYLSLSASIVKNSLPIQDTIRRLRALYLSLHDSYSLRKEEGSQYLGALELVAPIYRGFLEKMFREPIEELKLTQIELTQKSTIQVIQPFFSLVSHLFQVDEPLKNKKEAIDLFQQKYGSAWRKLLMLFFYHLKEQELLAVKDLEGDKLERVEEAFFQNCCFILETASQYSTRDIEQLFGKEQNVEFCQIKWQLNKGLNLLLKQQIGFYQNQIHEARAFTSPIETTLLQFEKGDYILTSLYHSHAPLLESIQRQLQQSQLEANQIKADYFFKLENREWAKKRKKAEARFKAPSPSASTKAFIESAESEDELLLKLPAENARVSSPSKAPKIKKRFLDLLNQGIAQTISPLDKQRHIFQQDAVFHFNHFLRSLELLHLLKEEGSSKSKAALLPNLVYHLGLANEQALTPMYLTRFPDEDVTHDVALMAGLCQTAVSQVKPLNQASIAFRYPYEQKERLRWMSKERPLGLQLILASSKNRLEATSDSEIEEMVKEGAHHFTACLSQSSNFASLKPLLNKTETCVQQALKGVSESFAENPSLEYRRELLAAVNFIEKRLSPIQDKLQEMASRYQDKSNLLKTIDAHLAGFRGILSLASLYPYQRFVSFFQGALLVRGQYALENSARLIALLEGDDWRSHSLREYSLAYQIEEGLTKGSQKLWQQMNLKKALDYPFWHLAKTNSVGSADKTPSLKSLYESYQLSLAALNGEGFTPSRRSEKSLQKTYRELASFSQGLASLIEEVLQKKVFNRLTA